ncbi:MAG TPA: arylsulfotransferase family protein [Solirubrobacteraceae bacterium]|nr:arylsulfotransferase family protein [Solirubrobacteraceae bacterium]
MRRRRAVGLLTATVALVLGAGWFADGATAAVTVYPIPGARYEFPATQIAFRGVAAGQIGAITVTGSKSGAHTGAIDADSDGNGGSFIPSRPFDPGETVTVTTGLAVTGASAGTFSFQIAHPARAIPPAPLPVVPAGANGVQRFRSQPSFRAPAIDVTKNSAPAGGGDIFVAPQFGPEEDGPMILDPQGRVVWFDPTSVSSKLLTTDFRTQTLFGQPVLTWWQGYTNSGTGRGAGYIYGSDYRPEYVVKAADGMAMDLHEFTVTNDGDALILSAAPVWLPKIGRPVIDSVIQEIDIKTGLVLFEWHALDHIGVQESFTFGPHAPGHYLDPYHFNSLDLDPDGNLVVSARNTSAIYKISTTTGQILWRLGGKRSSFKMGPGTTTAFQHNAIVQPDGTITAFDDGAGPPKVHASSRGIRVAIDLTHMTATLVHEYQHAPKVSAAFEGSMEALPGGDLFLGWGQQPYFSESTASGVQDFDAHFVAPTSSYRAYRLPWSGQPATAPALAIAPNPDGTMSVYASWNGATSVSAWRVLAGAGAGAGGASLQAVGDVPRHGFETAITVHSGDPDFEAEALGPAGQVLGRTQVAGAGQRIAVYGRSAFVSSASGLAGVPASCFANRACSIVTTVTSGRTVLARSGRETIPANASGLLYFRLSPGARAALAHSRTGRLSASVTAENATGFRSTVPLTLVGFGTRGAGPHRSASAAGALRLLGATDFVRSDIGVGGILAACSSPNPCTEQMTIAAGSTVIATTGSESLGGNQAGYLAFTLTAAGRSLLARAGGNQLAAHVTIAGSSSVSGDVALVGFR